MIAGAPRDVSATSAHVVVAPATLGLATSVSWKV
jgi:hypothetical protein